MTFQHLPKVIEETQPLADAFESAGHRLFLVGGVVRDLWLDLKLPDDLDIDLTTDAVPDQTKELVGPLAEALWLQGERFGTVGCRIGGRDVEITTHRTEAYESDSRKPLVEYSTEIATDLSRRDFTTNAMAIELPGGELIDPFGGADDLGSGTLRTPLGAEISFSDDPLRMLRAARFSAKYDLAPADDVVFAMEMLAPRLDVVARERIHDELAKLLAIEDPSDALLLLHGTRLLERVFPKLSAELDGNPGPLVAVAVVHPSDLVGRLAAIAWWDVEAQTKAGVRKWASSHMFSNATATAVATVVDGAARVTDALGNDAELRRWAFSVGEHRERALRLARRTSHDAAHALEERLSELEQKEDLDADGLGLSGAEVMELLDLEEGPAVGRALDLLAEQRFANGPLTREQAVAALETFVV